MSIKQCTFQTTFLGPQNETKLFKAGASPQTPLGADNNGYGPESQLLQATLNVCTLNGVVVDTLSSPQTAVFNRLELHHIVRLQCGREPVTLSGCMIVVSTMAASVEESRLSTSQTAIIGTHGNFKCGSMLMEVLNWQKMPISRHKLILTESVFNYCSGHKHIPAVFSDLLRRTTRGVGSFENHF